MLMQRLALPIMFAVIAIGGWVSSPQAQAAGPTASTFLFQWDDGEPVLTGNTYQDGILVQSVAVGNESYSGPFGLWNSSTLSQDFNVAFNIFDPDGVTLSDTWHLVGTSGNGTLDMAFESDSENGPALTPLANAQSLIETGDWQTVLEFTVSNGDHYTLQFRSDVAEVPEPATLALLGLGLAGLGFSRRKRAT